jgi:hypothetical protein
LTLESSLSEIKTYLLFKRSGVPPAAGSKTPEKPRLTAYHKWPETQFLEKFLVQPFLKG